MKVLLEIKENKMDAFMRLLEGLNYVKADTISEVDAALLLEIKEIQQAFKHAEQLQNGTLKARPVENLLNEL